MIYDQYLAVTPKTGEIVTLMGNPEISPDGQRIAIVKSSEQSDVLAHCGRIRCIEK